MGIDQDPRAASFAVASASEGVFGLDPDDPLAAGCLAALVAAFGPEAARRLACWFEVVSVAGGEVLFREGDEADALYIVVSGAVGISTEERPGRTRRIARVGPPDTIGELAFLTDAPRSATATTLRDCTLLRISREAFDTVVTQVPEASLRIARLLARRGREANARQAQAGAIRSATLACLPVTEGVSTADLARALARRLDGRSLVLAAAEDETDETGLHRIEAAHDHVVYASEETETVWGRLCVRRADHVLLVAAAGRPVSAPALVQRVRALSPWTRRDLVVVQPPGAAMPSPAAAALDACLDETSLRFHLRQGDTRDLLRLARAIDGRALGLVLSGGGARGFAHLGVLRALDEAGVPIDVAGGTSIGAVIGAALAMGWSLDEMSGRVVDAFVSTPPLNDYTLPLVALTRGLKVDGALNRHFGEARIETLWRPYYAVSANLSTGTAHVHRRGSLVQALRASVAIPGLLPPVLAEEGVLVDGAMIDNLPVDVMAAYDRGPVLAVDVASDAAMLQAPRRSWRSRFLRRWLAVPHGMPGVTEILLRAATVSSDHHASAAREKATFVIRPPLAAVELRAWRSHREIERIGYEHTCRMIEAGILNRLEARDPP